MNTLPSHWPKRNRQKLPKKFLKIPAQTGGQKCVMIAGISNRGIKNIQNVNKLTKNMFYDCFVCIAANTCATLASPHFCLKKWS